MHQLLNVVVTVVEFPAASVWVAAAVQPFTFFGIRSLPLVVQLEPVLVPLMFTVVWPDLEIATVIVVPSPAELPAAPLQVTFTGFPELAAEQVTVSPLGATVSLVLFVVPAADELPAASVATAL